MPDTHFSGGPYQTQDIIRTIHISYQPYMPFTQTYSMGLRENSTDPLKANYFRIGPPDVEDTKNSTGDYDGTYPYKLLSTGVPAPNNLSNSRLNILTSISWVFWREVGDAYSLMNASLSKA